MSRPKIGSVTTLAGRRERDAVHPEQDRLPCPRHRSADDQRDEQGDARRAPSRRAGVRSGRSPASKTIAWSLRRPVLARTGRAHRTPSAPPRRSSAAWAASLMRSNSDAERPGAVRRWRRGEASGQPEVAEEDDERRGRTAPTPSPRVAVSRVQKTESKPTLLYHRASVHRSSPTLNRRKTARTMTTIARRPKRRPARAARPARRRRSDRPGRGPPPAPLRRLAGARCRSVAGARRRCRRRRRPPSVVASVGRLVVALCGCLVVRLVGVIGGLRRRQASAVRGAFGRGRLRLLAARGRLALAQLVHEVVEQVAH